MNLEEFERLAWERIDGVISPIDRDRLEQRLTADADARDRYVELESLSGLLSEVELETPPAELRPRIDSAVAAALPRWRRPPVAASVWRPRVAFLAAGLVFGALAALLLTPGPGVDGDLVTGAMHAVSVGDTLTEEFDLGEGRGLLALSGRGSALTAELRWEAAEAVELELELAGGIVRLVGASHDAGSAGDVTVDGGRVVLRGVGPGRHLLTTALEGPASVARVSVKSSGRVLVDREFDLEVTED